MSEQRLTNQHGTPIGDVVTRSVAPDNAAQSDAIAINPRVVKLQPPDAGLSAEREEEIHVWKSAWPRQARAAINELCDELTRLRTKLQQAEAALLHAQKMWTLRDADATNLESQLAERDRAIGELAEKVWRMSVTCGSNGERVAANWLQDVERDLRALLQGGK